MKDGLVKSRRGGIVPQSVSIFSSFAGCCRTISRKPGQ